PMFCFALLTVASALATFIFACVTPFAAYAVIAAAVLPLRPALIVVIASWLVNQAVGFGFLHYPADANTMAWGLVSRAAPLAATVAAFATLRLVKAATPVALAGALIAAYATYEIALFAATPFLGGEGAFTASIIANLGALSALWTLGLVAACEVTRLSHAV